MIPQDIIDKLNLYWDPISDEMRFPHEKYHIVLLETDKDDYLDIFLVVGKYYLKYKMSLEWIRDVPFFEAMLNDKIGRLEEKMKLINYEN